MIQSMILPDELGVAFPAEDGLQDAAASYVDTQVSGRTKAEGNGGLFDGDFQTKGADTAFVNRVPWTSDTSP